MSGRLIRPVLFASVLAVAISSMWWFSAGRAEDGVLNDLQTKASREAKLAIERTYETQRQAAVAAPRPAKDPNRGSGAPQSVPPWPLGVFETGQAPFSSKVFVAQNHWRGLIGSEYLTVYAGARADDPTQGVVLVMTNSTSDLSDRTGTSGGLYPTASRLGTLRIVSASGTTVTLAAATGARFEFDVTKRILVAQP